MSSSSATDKKEIFRIKNMVSNSCIRLVRTYLEDLNISIEQIRLGEVTIAYDTYKISRENILKKLKSEGFPVILSSEEKLLDELKRAIIDLVHHSTFNAMVRNSDYLVERFNVSYQYLSAFFSKMEGITLEKFIILHRIEKVKSLIIEDEMSMSEIAFSMGYSSSQYLSTQFKSVVGVSVTEFKKDPGRYRIALEKLGDNE